MIFIGLLGKLCAQTAGTGTATNAAPCRNRRRSIMSCLPKEKSKQHCHTTEFCNEKTHHVATVGFLTFQSTAGLRQRSD